MFLKPRILPEDIIVVYNLNLIFRNREEQVVRVEGVTQVLEIVDRKSEPHEVEPPVALKRELASPFVCKLPDEGLLVRNLGGSESGKTCACTCPVQVET